MLLKRKKIDLPTLADIENATAKSEANSLSIDDVMSALAELGELFAEQDEMLFCKVRWPTKGLFSPSVLCVISVMVWSKTH